MRFDAGLLGTVCAWQVVGICVEAAPLVGSGWASVPGVSSLMIWLTDCPLTDGGARMLLGQERRQWRVMVPLRPWQLSWHLALDSVIQCSFSCGEGTNGSWGRGSSESGLPVSPVTGSLLELSHQAAPTQGRDSSCIMETPRPS